MVLHPSSSQKFVFCLFTPVMYVHNVMLMACSRCQVHLMFSDGRMFGRGQLLRFESMIKTKIVVPHLITPISPTWCHVCSWHWVLALLMTVLRCVSPSVHELKTDLDATSEFYDCKSGMTGHATLQQRHTWWDFPHQVTCVDPVTVLKKLLPPIKT